MKYNSPTVGLLSLSIGHLEAAISPEPMHALFIQSPSICPKAGVCTLVPPSGMGD